MKLNFTFICILLFLLNCKKNSDTTLKDFAYIGGEIVNPTEKYISLSKNNKIIDTIYLDGNNRFSYK